MFTENKDTFAEVVDITLYRYNSVDNRIWAILKNSEAHKKLSKHSILVSSDSLKELLLAYFRKEINRVESLHSSIVHKEATSVYFLWKMLEDLLGLRWVKFTLNSNVAYNRVVDIDDMKTIKYSVKVVRGTLRMFDIFNPAQLPLINTILYKANILKPNQQFTIIKVEDLMTKLDILLAKNNSSEIATPVNAILAEIDQYHTDNPELLLVTDFD
jgi:hypothetical protein